MSNIKKQNSNGNWDVLASGKATGIAVTNPKLIDEGETIESVDAVLEKHQDAIDKLQHNVSWLAKHGGGGSGGSGGGGSDVTEATCDITVNDNPTGSNILIDENGLKISLTNISAKVNKTWVVTVRIGATQIASTSLSYTSPTTYLDLSKVSPYLTNHTGNLTIGASYEDETNGIYGSSSWSGTVLEAIVNVSTSNYSFNLDKLDTAQLIYNYSVGIVGAYTMNILIEKNGAKIVEKEIAVTINSTSEQIKTIDLSSIIPSGISSAQLVGVYNITTSLFYNTNPQVQGSTKNTVTIVSDEILVASTVMSESQSNPVEISLSASINIVFTAYLQGATTFRYKVQIDNTIVKQDAIGYFGTEVNEYLPVNGDWAKEDAIVPLILTVSSGEKKLSKTYYIKFVKATDTFLSISDTSKTHLLSEFLSRNYNTGDSKFSLTAPDYEQGGSTYAVSSVLETLNGNSLSVITKLSTGLPYLRLSNGAYASLGSFRYNNKDYTLPNLIVTNAFTMSLCFKADYHPDDDRAILFCGTTDATTGTLTGGISIDVHDIYINNRSVAKLTDNTINSVDITCQKVTAKDVNSKGEEISYVTFIIKVYVDGVLTAVTKEPSFPNLSDKIYFGGGLAGGNPTYLCDCNIYNFQLYDTALTDFDIMINYINNKVSTSYANNQPNFSIITEELKTNFCERASDGSVTSYMFKNGEYTIDFLLDGSSHLDATKLNNYAKVLGIPIMLIDVSSDANWTFNAFVTQQTAGNVSLPETSGRTIQYWDPNGANTSIINITNASVKLQGTSTLSDSVKNLNITVPEDTVFIPKSTWFPEQTYTLKADVVDSSHSNNASIGGFINEQLGYDEQEGGAFFQFDKNAINNVYTANYKKNQQPTATLKHTVEGFPVFLIMKFNTNVSSTISVTPLGIYSFNLGRDAYRNLGFKKVNNISDSVGDVPSISVFPYLLENAKIDETDSDANWIEISDTTSIKDLIDVTDSLPNNFDCSKGDFWQDDASILDARYEVRFGSKEAPSQYENFKTFVKNIMSLPIEGCSTTDVIGNRDQHQITGSYAKYKVDAQSNYTRTGETNEFITDSNSLPADLGFNEDSAYKYFVIGLLFGLIDNFGKNSTYRSWAGGQYYTDFYDLDCALEGDNQGELSVTPDLWIKYLYNAIQENKNYGYVCETFDIDKTYTGEGANKSQTGSGTVVSANHNKLWLSIDTPFFRGYKGNTSNSIYTQYWYQLREKMDELADAAGYTNFADYFIDEFYIKQTKSCGPLLFNYDYKLKYLLQFSGNEYNTTKDLSKLHGRKIAVARDWLKKHIAFLDSLFYWRDSSQTLNFKNDLDSRGSNTVLNTPESLPMVSNTPLLVYNSVGDSAKTFYFMQTNMKTYVNTAGNSSNSPLTWNFSNSPNIIELGDTDTPLSKMNVRVLSSTANSRGLNYEGYPSITNLLLGNNRSFASSFSLESFSKSTVSELRTIDLSNTSGESFTLNLVNTASDGTTYTKFSKLTSINISNSSCVSNLTIPTIPLNELMLINSSITNFNLSNQKYITGVDLTGCSKLITVEIKECDSYKELKIADLANLESVKVTNCSSISSIVITNCPMLKTVNIEQCNNLTTIQITKCDKLKGGGTTDNYIRIADCNNINSLDLSNNSSLEKVVIDGCDRTKIKTLRLHQTNVTDISSNSNADTSMRLDLTEFSNLATFTCYYNKKIKYIAFANNKNAPIPITRTFQQCPELLRIYGCVQLRNDSYSGVMGLFKGCSKFSIHGTAISTWNGKSVKNSSGVWNTPWEMLKSDPSEYSTLTWEDTFTTGSTATNIRFSNSPNLLTNLFRGTALTQFDVYYILCVLALSNVKLSQSASFTFREIPTMFDWKTGNQPNRYMFYGCSMITSFGETFSSGTTYLYSPTVEDGKVTADDGLFSPLTNLTSIGSMFGSIVCSKYLFHRKDGTYPITSLSYENIYRIYDSDEVSTSYSDLSNTMFLANNYTKIGNYDGFFDCLPKLTTISNFAGGQDFINYSNLVIPTTVVTIVNAFNASTGMGTIDLRKMFTSGSKCTKIANSFKVGYNASVADIVGKVKFPIANDTFTNLKSLVCIGYNSGDNGGGTETSTSFSGDGLDKYIEGSTFPSDIVSSLTDLQIFSGFFKSVRGDLSSVPSIPGNMFLRNTKLNNVSSMMYNASISFTLSGDGFKNCPNLSNVAYFCYHDITSDADNRSKLTGSIPYHLFYHGTSGTENRVFRGTNQETKPDSDFDMKNLLSETLSFPIMRRNITKMNRCFYGCVSLEPYTMTTEDVESNTDYSPYKWMYNETAGTWYEGSDTKKIDASWSYDGASAQNSNYKYLDTGATLATANILSGKTETLHYMCPPDLFRYCTNLNSTKIQGAFENCGLNYVVGTGGWINNNETYYSTGITGRIPPHLLRPLSNITDISYMFKNCRRLSSYLDGSLVYQIPRDFFSYATKITSLVETFQGLAFQPGTNLAVFGTLTGALDVRGIMQSCIWGKDTVNWNITGVFSTNTISRASGAFSMKDLTINDSATLGVSAPEYRTISVPSLTAISNNFSTSSSKVPASTAIGYVYYLWGSKASDTAIKDENNNYSS